MNQEELKEFGSRVQQARKAANMTQAQLGKKIGKTRQMISNYEKALGKNFPGVDVTAKIAKVLGVKHEWLLHGDKADSDISYYEEDMLKKGLSAEDMEICAKCVKCEKSLGVLVRCILYGNKADSNKFSYDEKLALITALTNIFKDSLNPYDEFSGKH